MTGAMNLDWRPPGPVALAFYRDYRRVVGIQGPVGSGKTSAVLMKQIRMAMEQKRSPKDGIRRYRCVAVRDTYRQLWRTTIPSWWNWVPQDVGHWVGGSDQPAEHHITFMHPGDGGLINFEIAFTAIGDNRAEDVLRGYEVTRWYLNEADLLDPEVFTYCRGRWGRYPRAADGGPVHHGADLDFNAPDVESYIYEQLIENRPPEWGYYSQPGGVTRVDGGWKPNPRAENMPNLPENYYEDQIVGQPEWYIQRMVASEFGYSREGKPVYAEWNDRLHCAPQDLEPDRGLPLGFGFDAGGSPAGVITQRRPNGQKRVLEEIIAGEDGYCGPDRFSDEVNRVLQARYAGLETGPGSADPSAMYGADKEAGEMNWIEIVSNKTGIRIWPAPTNEITPRQDAVRIPLTKMIDGREPALIISPRCKILRRGFNSMYRYRRMHGSAGRTYAPTPDKNEFSHVHDALQYDCLSGDEYYAVMGRQEAGLSPVLDQAQVLDDDDDYGAPAPRRRRRRREQQAFATE